MNSKMDQGPGYGKGKSLAPLAVVYSSTSTSVEEVFQKKNVPPNTSTVSLGSATGSTPYLQLESSCLKRGVSPRCKPNHHYARVVANVLADCPCDRPITAPRIYADKELCFILVSDISTEEELRLLINTKYGTRFEAKDIFRLPKKFFEEGQGDTSTTTGTSELDELTTNQCGNCDNNYQVLPIFSEKYKTRLLSADENDNEPRNSKTLTKFHLDGKNAQIEPQFEIEYEPEYLIEFDIMDDGQIQEKTDEAGQPLYFHDSQGKKVVKKDSEGHTIYKVDSEGHRVSLTDEAGQPIFKVDQTGEKIVRRDEIGSPVFNIKMATNSQKFTKLPQQPIREKPKIGKKKVSIAIPKSLDNISKAKKASIAITNSETNVKAKKEKVRKASSTQNVRKKSQVVKEKDIFDEYRIFPGDGESNSKLDLTNESSKRTVRSIRWRSFDNMGIGDEVVKAYRMDGSGDNTGTRTTLIEKENAQLKGINKQLKIKLKELTQKLEKKKLAKISKGPKPKRIEKGSGDCNEVPEAEQELQHVYQSIRNVIRKQAKIAKELHNIRAPPAIVKEFKPHLKLRNTSPVKVFKQRTTGRRRSLQLLDPKLLVGPNPKFQRVAAAESSYPPMLPLAHPNFRNAHEKQQGESPRIANFGEDAFSSRFSVSSASSSRNFPLTPTISNESIQPQRFPLPEPVLTPSVSDIMLIVQALYPRKSWVKGNAVAVRYYPDGKVFCTSYANGSGQVFYPHGGLALIVSAPNPVNQVLVIRDPTDEFFLPDRAILADFDTFLGNGLVNTTEGMGKQKFRLHYDKHFGHLEGSSNLPKRWNWSQGGTRLTLKINQYFSLRVMNLNQVHLIFNGNQRGLRINVGKTEFPIVLQTVRKDQNTGENSELFKSAAQLQREKSSLWILDKSKYSSNPHDMKSNHWNYLHRISSKSGSSEIGISLAKIGPLKSNYNYAISTSGNVNVNLKGHRSSF